MDIYKPDSEYKVLVRCYTYNHASYIEEALKGFSMQETDFPYVCVVVDDASTDGEDEVIKTFIKSNCSEVKVIDMEYSTLLLSVYKENENCNFAFYLLKENLYKQKKKRAIVDPWCDKAKYCAVCEGDDYWIDPLKLQKQVDFMERNPNFSMCFGDVIYFNSDKKKSKGRISSISRKNNLELEKLEGEDLFYKILIGGCYIQNLSVVYRMSSFKSIQPNKIRLAMGDTPRLLDLSQQGKIKYIDEVMGVYNIHKGSATHTDLKKRLRFDLSIEEMRTYYCIKYNYEIPAIVKRKYNKAYMRLLAAGIEFSALYEPFVDNTWQIWQIWQIKNNTWYKGVYNNYILPVQKIVEYICIKGDVLRSIIWNKL